MLPTLLLTLFTKILALIIIYLIFDSFGLGLDILKSGQIFFTSQIIGLLTFIPGGIVVTETSLLALLQRENISFALASVAVITLRFFTIWLATIIGIISYFKISKNKLQK